MNLLGRTTYRVCSAGRKCFSVREASSNAYRVPGERSSSLGEYRASVSDKRQRNGRNWPIPNRCKIRWYFLSAS